MKLHILSFEEPLSADGLEKFNKMLGEAMERSGIEGQVLVTNQKLETISKEELLEGLNDG